jgi:parvulin-like peptidyl-prolyl isomerase
MSRAPSESRSSLRIRGARAASAVPLLGVLALGLLAGCGAPAEGPSAGAGAGAVSRPAVWHPPVADTLGPVVAIVGGDRITRHEVDSLLTTAPPQLQQQYRSSPEQYRSVVERIVNNATLYQAAIHDSVPETAEFRAGMARAARDLASKIYYRRMMEGAPTPPDTAVEAYYQAHLKDFFVPGRAQVKHILFRTKAEAQAARKRLMQGATWASVCEKESRDYVTKKNEGAMGYITSDSDLVPGLGTDSAFVKAAWALKEGEISRPIHTSKGWNLVLVDDRHEATHRPLSDVRSQIEGRLKGASDEAFTQAKVDSLRTFFGATVFDDSIAMALQPAKTPQQLFEAAQGAASPMQRIALFKELVAQYPKERVSEQADFMIGFTYAEEMADSVSAHNAFEEFIKDHPKSDLVPSAKWMLQNMNKPNPPFQDTSPDTTEPAKGK